MNGSLARSLRNYDKYNVEIESSVKDVRYKKVKQIFYRWQDKDGMLHKKKVPDSNMVAVQGKQIVLNPKCGRALYKERKKDVRS